MTWIDDLTGKTVKTEDVVLDDSATAPIAPRHSGYVFVGYDIDDWAQVSDDMEIRLLYDWDAIVVPETGGAGAAGLLMVLVPVSAVMIGAVCIGIGIRKHKKEQCRDNKEGQEEIN